MDLISNSVTVFLIVAYFTSNVFGEDVCAKTGPCTCMFPNGTGIDLSPVDKTQLFTATNYQVEGTERKQYTLTTYYYHPCYDVVVPGMMNKTNSNDTCDKPLALCRHVDTMSLLNSTQGTYQIDSGLSSFLGSANETTFSAQGNSITYTTNKPSGSTVLLICAETDDQLQAGAQVNPSDLVLMFYSRSACLKTLVNPDEGRSLGSTLLIIFFSFVIFYLVLGVCTKKFLMGATGVEVIPNLGFWTDLPNLVKDGWAFAINGFKLPARGPGPMTSPDPNSYDSI